VIEGVKINNLASLYNCAHCDHLLNFNFDTLFFLGPTFDNYSIIITKKTKKVKDERCGTMLNNKNMLNQVVFIYCGLNFLVT
jgi:hypothetical protein